MFQPVDPKKRLPEVEHEILNFWEKEKIFEKSVEQRKGKKRFVFFDGPPFANGLPHYGHILANALKDAVTRYYTMKGFYVPRVNGWDCHGLPVEYEIEKELKIAGKKEIEKMGVSKFNAACRESVFRYTDEWEKMLTRIARWVDMEHSYATLENSYMESIWWVFHQIWKKGMVHQDYKSMHICPRCETPLSNFEVTLGYKEVADLSVTVKFELKDEPNTYFLAWTTTPWSLLSTMGLAVGPDFDYVKVKTADGSFYYLAEARLATVFEGIGEYEIIEKKKGKDLIGKRYRHLFPYFENHPEVKKNSAVYHTVSADYVSTGDGTGIVTINGSYGEIDFGSAKKHSLPIVVDVGTDGKFKPECGEFAGLFVKTAEPKIADYLAAKNLLFRKDPIRHSYPHCWRCDTPLMNYATKGWFIKVTEIKEKLLKNNKRIHWVPSHISEGRFGKWLENVKDWNVSRNRFWGCPMPIWECSGCGFQKCISSVKELRENSEGGNTYIFVRHGEAENNALGVDNSDPGKIFHLTKKGREQAEQTAKSLKNEPIDLLFSSPYARTKETAEILAKGRNLEVQLDQHLREHDLGMSSGEKTGTYSKQFQNLEERFEKKLPGTESFEEVEERIAKFLDYCDKKYSGKTILLVTHGDVVRAALHFLGEKNIEETFASVPPFASINKLSVGKLPKRSGELDLHKPYIDEITFSCEKCRGTMKRIPEVLDCWFESGSMPYAQLHYPFENKEEFEKKFPAQFIAEGLDQTRGWFYTLHVLAAILFNEPAFQNVIVNGILLAANGEKLSKRKKNYPDPSKLFETHGVDSTRLFLYTSTAPLAEDVRFSEKHVEEIVKNFTLVIWNTYSFFVTYASIDRWEPNEKNLNRKPKNKLDQWMLSELHMLIDEMTEAMDAYNLTKATRPLLTFADKLSNWYVRRSRRRFWKSENDEDKFEAYGTLYTVLVTLCKLMAPFLPFLSDAIYRNLTGEKSVHLEDWPLPNRNRINGELNEANDIIRTIVTLGHSLRSAKTIKVRQPLSLVQIALPKTVSSKIIKEYEAVLTEELNVKKVEVVKDASLIASSVFRPNPRVIGPKYGDRAQEIFRLCREGKFEILKNGKVKVGEKTLDSEDGTIGYEGKEGHHAAESEGIVVALDVNITPELQEEGYIRELVRNIQEMRKEAGYQVSDRIAVAIHGDSSFLDTVTKFSEFIKKETLADEIQERGNFEWDREQTLDFDGVEVVVAVRK